MARISKDFRGTSQYAKYQTAFLELEYVSQNIAENKSTFRYRAYIKSNVTNGSGYTDQGSYTFSGAVSASASGLKWSWNYSSSQIVKDWTSFTVSHRSDGTLPDQTVQLTVGTGSEIGSATLSLSVSAPTIPRASTPRLSKSSVNYGQTVTIYTDRASASFTHKIKAKWNGQTAQIASGVSVSYDWKVPFDYMLRIPNNTSTVGTIVLETYNGTSLIGSKWVRLTTIVPPEVVPSVSTASATEAVSGLANKFGAFVQNKSKLKLSIAGTGSYGSSIKSTSMSIGGQVFTGSSATTSPLQNSGNQKITFKVVDSRGRTKTKEVTFNVLPYSDPEILSFKVQRCDSSGNPKLNGEKVKISYKAKISPVNNKNNKKFSVRYRQEGGSWTTELLDSSSYTPDASVVLTSNFDNKKVYYFELLAEDYFDNPARAQNNVLSGKVTFHAPAGGNGFAFGKYSTQPDSFDVGFPAIFRKNVQIYPNQNGEGRLHIFDQAQKLLASFGLHPDVIGIHFYDHQGKGFNFITNKGVYVNGKKFLPDDVVTVTPDLTNGWTKYTATYPNFTARKLTNGMVFLSGSVSGSNATATTVTVLPSGFRPVKSEIFIAQAANGPVRVEVSNAGSVMVIESNFNRNWVSFSGLQFYAG